jgi:hypothetical protein
MILNFILWALTQIVLTIHPFFYILVVCALSFVGFCLLIFVEGDAERIEQ